VVLCPWGHTLRSGHSLGSHPRRGVDGVRLLAVRLQHRRHERQHQRFRTRRLPRPIGPGRCELLLRRRWREVRDSCHASRPRLARDAHGCDLIGSLWRARGRGRRRSDPTVRIGSMPVHENRAQRWHRCRSHRLCRSFQRGRTALVRLLRPFSVRRDSRRGALTSAFSQQQRAGAMSKAALSVPLPRHRWHTVGRPRRNATFAHARRRRSRTGLCWMG
jgi:hypothetical protein